MLVITGWEMSTWLLLKIHSVFPIKAAIKIFGKVLTQAAQHKASGRLLFRASVIVKHLSLKWLRKFQALQVAPP
jgi:hypothetical protein